MNYLAPLIALLLPLTSFAVVYDVFDTEFYVLGLVQKLGFLFVIIAIIVFFWGLVKFINNASDTSEHEEGKRFIVGSLIAFTVLFSIWGIVALVLQDTLGIYTAPVEFIDSHGNVVL